MKAEIQNQIQQHERCIAILERIEYRHRDIQMAAEHINRMARMFGDINSDYIRKQHQKVKSAKRMGKLLASELGNTYTLFQ
jgi:archaellum component FlaC